jgi:putative hydrolases of HD superfamily
MTDRLGRQIAFILEADKVKRVLRQNPLADGSRRENDAEHMWHLALMAVVLSEYAAQPVDVLRVVKMLLVHDLVEIDTGDTFVYDEQARAGKVNAERAAAERIFGLLPAGQADGFRALWEEFEDGSTSDARFARAVDRLHPMLLNSASGRDSAWVKHGITADRVLSLNAPIGVAAPDLWEHAKQVVAEATASGILE